jgi:U3 small nucleolar RNA-associated protein 25
MNMVPKESHDCDFSRVRPYVLDGQSAYLRQTLIFSGFNAPELNNIYNNHFKNIQGRIKVTQPYNGTLHETVVQVPQLFHRFDAPNAVEEPDARFQFFIKKILPSLSQSALLQSQTLIFIPSYFDFVRLRNHFKHHEYSFAKLSEYSPNAEISRSRGEFFHGKVSFLLVTERFHYFRRYRIRGAKNIVFYGLPANAQFYSELINQMEDTQESAVMALFSKYDRPRLERIIGTKRVDKMVKGVKDSYMFS